MHSAPVEVGEVLAGKYRVERVLGVGGMGVVVAAMHLQLDKMVALKFMLEEFCLDPEVTARFAREARAAAQLRTEYINKVLDVGTLDNGAPYMVMEFLEGSDLKKLMKERKAAGQGPLPVPQAVDYILQACLGMAEAHAHGFIHRDLKPPNLFLTQGADGLPLIKILDFGIARASNDGIDTSTQTVMGSPLYMPPEQWEGARYVDERGDIWALGAILQYLLSGHPPFHGESLPVLFTRVASKEPRSLDIRELAIPPGLQEVVKRCLAKAAVSRPQSVVELASLLAPFGSTHAAEYARKAHRVGGAPGQAAALAAPKDAEYTGAAPGPAEHTLGQPSLGPSQVATRSDGAKPSPPRNSRKWLPLAGIAVVAVAAIAIGALSGETESSDGTQPEAATASEEEATPEVAAGPEVAAPPEEAVTQMVQMKLTTEPEGAEIRVDGMLQGVAPLDVDLIVGSDVWLRVDLDGYKFIEEEISVQSDMRARHVVLAAAEAVALAGADTEDKPEVADEAVDEPEAENQPMDTDVKVAKNPQQTKRGSRKNSAAKEDEPVKEKSQGPSIPELVAQAQLAVRNTQYGKSGRLCRQVLDREPDNQDAIIVCAIAACNLKNGSLAKKYVRRIKSRSRRNGLKQICARLDVGDL